MTEDFCVVTRKKWMTRRCLQRRPRRISDKSYDSDCPDVDVDKFIKRLDQLCEQMSGSEYFTQAMATLEQGLITLSPNNKPERVVCFGIGPFTRNFQALHQLAFILEAQKYYKTKEAYFFDPIFRDSEKEVLERLQCTLMRKNCEAKFEADVVTLFYMPHCPNCLTNNLLWRNWHPKLLHNTVLINNSFASLVSSKPESILRLDAGYILNVLAYSQEFALEDDYKTHNIFNDLSVHVFPMQKLPQEQNKEFWAEKEAPKYTDVEMISAADFDKINIA